MKPLSFLLLIFAAKLSLFTTTQAEVVPHPVPWECSSARYIVSVNGKPVNVFFAAMNLHFASFDFADHAEVSWQWLTGAAVTRERDGFTLQQSGQSLHLRVESPERFTFAVEDVSAARQPFDSPNPGLTRLSLRLHTPAYTTAQIVVIAEPGSL